MEDANIRRIALLQWLQEHNPSAYNYPVRREIFLFLCSAFLVADGEYADDGKAAEDGEQNVSALDIVQDGDKAEKAEHRQPYLAEQHPIYAVNDSTAHRVDFVISSLSGKELLEFVSCLHAWNTKGKHPADGELYGELEEGDFSESDCTMIHMLQEIYPSDMIQNCRIVSVKEKYFVFSADDKKLLTDQHFDILAELANCEDLHNPVWVRIDTDGELCVD